jgi:hypothetical protein
MPFMKGKAPVRRTLKYLKAGSLVLKDMVKVFCVNYNVFGDHHKGARYVFLLFNLMCDVEYTEVYFVLELGQGFICMMLND